MATSWMISYVQMKNTEAQNNCMSKLDPHTTETKSPFLPLYPSVCEVK